ncbi:MAG: DUF1194 domain-containing protein [Rhizobiaceae bacterium]
MVVSSVLWRMILASACVGVAANAARADQTVDVELVLAVDVSLSMSPDELEIQRHGYAAAMADKQVIDAILDGANGKIAVTYIEWAGVHTQRIIVPWTIISSKADADAFSAKLTSEVPQSARRTSISSGILFATDLFAESGLHAVKRVIDVSGDGPNNEGGPVTEARDKAVALGIIINGLPLMTNDGYISAYDLKDLDKYYANCVVGGPGSFMVPVNDWEQFPEAVRRKLVQELAGPPVQPRPTVPAVVKVDTKPAYNCLVGEQMWGDGPWNLNTK